MPRPTPCVAVLVSDTALCVASASWCSSLQPTASPLLRLFVCMCGTGSTGRWACVGDSINPNFIYNTTPTKERPKPFAMVYAKPSRLDQMVTAGPTKKAGLGSGRVEPPV